MKRNIIFIAIVFFSIKVKAQVPADTVIRKIFDNVLTKSSAYTDLKVLCKSIGGRLTGSPQSYKAIEWTKKTMEKYQNGTVYLQEVMVPHWVRGNNEQAILSGAGVQKSFKANALGGSSATGKNGITSEIIEINSYDQLEKTDVKGKIVFYNVPMNPKNINPFTSYGESGKYRWGGPNMASKAGAAASITRSMTINHDNFVHTGSTRFKDGNKAIPAFTISTNEADELSNLLKQNNALKMYLKNEALTLPDTLSYNVIAEIEGTEFPKEIITIGGHLDSWDTGEGAHDDGTGIVHCIELLRVFKELNIKPKRTIRIVAFMNEENGVAGGKKYAQSAKEKGEKHVVAIETDAGGFTPKGFSFTGSDTQKSKYMEFAKYFKPYNMYDFGREGGGSDIEPLNETLGTPIMDLLVESHRYFDVHHTPNDVFENVNKRELELGSAAIISMVYLISEFGL